MSLSLFRYSLPLSALPFSLFLSLARFPHLIVYSGFIVWIFRSCLHTTTSEALLLVSFSNVSFCFHFLHLYLLILIGICTLVFAFSPVISYPLSVRNYHSGIIVYCSSNLSHSRSLRAEPNRPLLTGWPGARPVPSLFLRVRFKIHFSSTLSRYNSTKSSCYLIAFGSPSPVSCDFAIGIPASDAALPWAPLLHPRLDLHYECIASEIITNFPVRPQISAFASNCPLCVVKALIPGGLHPVLRSRNAYLCVVQRMRKWAVHIDAEHIIYAIGVPTIDAYNTHQ